MNSPAGNTHDKHLNGQYVDDMYNLKHKMDNIKTIRQLFNAGSDEVDDSWAQLWDYTKELEQKYNCCFVVSVPAGQIMTRPWHVITDTQLCRRHGKCRRSCPDRVDYDGHWHKKDSE